MSRFAFASLALFASVSAFGATLASAQNTDTKKEWALDSFGPQGQCSVSRALDPEHPSQIAIGLNQDGTYLTLQNLQWRLPTKSTNMMKVKLKFESIGPIKTDALLMNRIHAFQIFSILMPIEEAEFWTIILSGEPLKVMGPFKPGTIAVQFDDLESALPILKDCADQYLPGRKLPFAIATS